MQRIFWNHAKNLLVATKENNHVSLGEGRQVYLH